MRNYAGHRLSPWLGHLMVSKAESPRPLLTPGEIMQLPASEEIVMLAGLQPIRARKARYFKDPRLLARIASPPNLPPNPTAAADGWTSRVVAPATPGPSATPHGPADPGGEGPEPRALSPSLEIPPPPTPADEFAFDDVAPDDDIQTDLAGRLDRRMARTARQAAMDPDDGVEL